MIMNLMTMISSEVPENHKNRYEVDLMMISSEVPENHKNRYEVDLMMRIEIHDSSSNANVQYTGVIRIDISINYDIILQYDQVSEE